MTENKKMSAEATENKPLTEEQLDKVSGGETVSTVQPVLYKRNPDDPTYIYP